MLKNKKLTLFIIIFLMFMTLNIKSLAVTGTVNVTAVRIREATSTESDIVTSIYENDKVEILEDNGEWCKVKYGDKVGYAKTEFFNKEGEETTQTSNSTPTETEKPEPETVAPEPETPVETSAEEPSVENQTVPEQTTEDTTSTNVQSIEIGNTYTLQNKLTLKIIPSLLADEKIDISQGETVNIETKMGNWCKVEGKKISGWITETKLKESLVSQNVDTKPVETVPQEEPAENIPEVSEPDTTETTLQDTSSRTGIVVVETARVRKTASPTGEVAGNLDEDAVVSITGEEGDFYKISEPEGYISKSLVRERDVTSRSSQVERNAVMALEANDSVNQALVAEVSNSVSAIGEDVVAFAKQYLGYQYVLGGSSPEAGFDCSGFTRYVFAHFGYEIGRVASDQTSVGDVIDRENLQKGDLILFYDSGKSRIGHCGIYIEDGNFIHSANSQRGVVIDNLSENLYYDARFVTARRIVKQ